jgi:hypothetical protein
MFKELVHTHAYVAEDYQFELKQITKNLKIFKNTDRTFQMPYEEKVSMIHSYRHGSIFILLADFNSKMIEEKTEEEMMRIQEKRREQGQRLKEQTAKRRQEKVRIFLCRSNTFNFEKHPFFPYKLKAQEDQLQEWKLLKESKSNLPRFEYHVTSLTRKRRRD